MKKFKLSYITKRLKNLGKNTLYLKILVIRGIGYRVFCLNNDLIFNSSFFENKLYNKDFQINGEGILQDLPQAKLNEFFFNQYLIIRAGHTLDLIQPLPFGIFTTTSKKDRKLIIYGRNKQLVNDFSYQLYKYRKPSTYTGRGIRRKHIKLKKKAGKKDKQKGKIF